MRTVRKLSAVMSSAFLLGVCVANAATEAGIKPDRAGVFHSVAVIRDLLSLPEGQIDFAKAKLTIDKLADPKIDVNASLAQIDAMVETVRAMAGPNPTTMGKLTAVRRFIYVDGDWNGHRPFQYDLADPLGTRIVDKLLPTYVATRRGNCVSMPILFIILADRLGVHVTLSTAPFHMFVKFVDDRTGKTVNLETTSGAYPARAIWYRQKIPMTDDAIRNGVYMKALTRKEDVAVMSEVLLEYFMAERRYREVIGVANAILQPYPNEVDAMVAEATAYAHLIDVEFRRKYPRPTDIPRALLPVYEVYVQENERLFDRALALGWRDSENKVTSFPPDTQQ